MKLWLLHPINPHEGPWDPWYDKAFGFVVRAENETEARAFAANGCGDEGEYPWINAVFSTCIELLPEGEQGVVIQKRRDA